MNPEELYTRYSAKADKLALDLCHFYAVSGALAYQDEACSEAKLALWRQAKNYDPKKQLMQRIVSEESYWAALIGYVAPVAKYKDPYDTFWISSIQRVRGAVLDFFRAQKLITKLPKPKDGEEPVRTMLYYERFVSISKPVVDFTADADKSETDTFGDMLASRDRADAADHLKDIRYRLAEITGKAKLSKQESKVIDLLFGEGEYTPLEVAGILGIPESKIKKIKNEALHKLKAVAVVSVS